jgi:transglutaminase-like putative cysteine protease
VNEAAQKRNSKWGGWRDWVNVVLLYIVLEIAVLSVEQAHWIEPQPMLSLVLFLSLLVVYILYRIKMPGVIKHFLALIIGLGVTLWQTLALMTPPAGESGLSRWLYIIQSWWQGPGALLPGENRLPFAVFITFLVWVAGYLSIWFLLRRGNSWVAVSLGALVVLVNLSNLPDTYYFYFFLYFFAAILLIAVTRMTGRTLKKEGRAGYSGKSLAYLGVSLLVITALAASVSWITPQARATGLQNLIASKLPWQRDVLESKFNILNAIPSKQASSTAGNLEDLPFEEAWHQGDEIEFIVLSERPSYWRVNAYDTYTSQGWENSRTDKTSLEAGASWADKEGPANREVMNYTVTAEMFTDVVLTSGGFISSDLPVRVNAGAAGDDIAVNALRVLSPGEQYTVTSYISSAAAGDLSAAGNNYPDSVKAAYLQLPDDFSDEIRQLSQNITRNAGTPYGKVAAIVDYLSQFPYELEVEPPPKGVDSVAYFLFESKSGYCLHFASAAVVMLRSVGIPSRLAAGYLPGDPGNVPGQYLLRDKYYHAWPQVYFPGYGWVDIEATPGGSGSQVSVAAAGESGPAVGQLLPDSSWQSEMPPEIPNYNSPDTGNSLVSEDSWARPLVFAVLLGRVLLFVLIAGLAIGLVAGLIILIKRFSFGWLWHVDRENLSLQAYTNLCKLAGMAGLAPAPQQTPLEFYGRLAKVFPQQAEAMDFIVQAYVTSRFGGRKAKPGLVEEAEILKARCLVYDALSQRLGKMKRYFAKR